MAQRTMQGKSYLYATLGAQIPLATLFGYQTATLRKARDLPKTHDVDALCIAPYDSGERVPCDREHFYQITFRPRRTRRRYHDLPHKGQGRVKYQVNEELEGFHKGDVVCVKRQCPRIAQRAAKKERANVKMCLLTNGRKQNPCSKEDP